MEELQALMERLLAGTATAQEVQTVWLHHEIRRTARVAEEIKHMAWEQAQSARQTKALETIASVVNEKANALLYATEALERRVAELEASRQ